MDVKDKLDVFSKLVMNEAQEKRRETLTEVEKQFKTAGEEAERKARANGEEIINRERFNIEQMKNKQIVEAQTRAKKELIELRRRLMDSLRKNVTGRLREFMASDDYERYLVEMIKQCAQSHGPLQARLMERDMIYAAAIQKETGMDVAASEEDFLGGFKAVVNDGRGLIDCSFGSRLDEEMKGFNEFRIT